MKELDNFYAILAIDIENRRDNQISILTGEETSLEYKYVCSRRKTLLFYSCDLDNVKTWKTKKGAQDYIDTVLFGDTFRKFSKGILYEVCDITEIYTKFQKSK